MKRNRHSSRWADETKSAVFVAAVFALVAAIWFFLIDRILARLFGFPADFTSIQILNDWAFVLLLAILLGWLVRRQMRLLRQKDEVRQVIADYTHDWENWHAPDGRLRWVNPSVFRLAGYTPEECMAMPEFPLSIIHEEDREMIKPAFFQELPTKTSGNDIPFRVRRKDGTLLWVAASWQPILDREGVFAGIRSSIRDISSRKEDEERLQELNRNLDAFVYTVSHDLRSPLTPIIGFADLLREQYKSELDPAGLEMLAEIEGQGKRMLAMMEDLLALARVGKVEAPAKPIVTANVVKEVMADLADLLNESGMEVKIGELPNIRVPESFLKGIFSNLVGNALRYAGKEGGPVEVGGKRRGDRVGFFCPRTRSGHTP